MSIKEEEKYFHAFNLIEKFGPISFKKILARFDSLKKAWLANAKELSQAGLESALINKINAKRPTIDPSREIEKVNQAQIEIITIKDVAYPRLLKEIYAPPALLYVRGSLKKEDSVAIAIVGTRKISSYGRQITPLLSAALSQSGLTIVSGLAKGIDTLAHQTALQNNGRTIAVLGSGIDQQSIYPPVNKELASSVAKQGALISEYPPATKPVAGNFPRRNRVIAGLSLGTVVIEAPNKSGALITARDALEQNREVFAVPGHILSPNTAGPHGLIKLGAKLVSQASDIIEELNLTSSFVRQALPRPDNEEEKIILKNLSYQPLHIDKIIKQTRLSTTIVNSTLALMEIKGKVKNIGAGQYILTN